MRAFRVDDMTCGHCASTISKAVRAIDADARVEIDLAQQVVRIDATNKGSGVSKHDHGAERNAPRAKASPCAAAAPASGAKASAKHDHAKFHKNQG